MVQRRRKIFIDTYFWTAKQSFIYSRKKKEINKKNGVYFLRLGLLLS